MRHVGLALTLLAAGATIANAAPAQAEAGAPAAKAPAKAKPKKVCRRVAKTGSILAPSVCHTPEEWEEMARLSGDQAQQMYDNRGAMGVAPQN